MRRFFNCTQAAQAKGTVSTITKTTIRVAYGLGELTALSMKDAFVLFQLLAFFLNIDENTEELGTVTWFSLSIAGLLGIPLTLTMIYYWSAGAHEHSSAVANETDEDTECFADPSNQHLAIQANDDISANSYCSLILKKITPSHHFCHGLGEFLVIGCGSFGLMTYGGTNAFLKNFKTLPTYGRILISLACGGLDAFGNTKLHSHHAHATGIFKLLSKLSLKQISLALFIATGIVGGHLAQGFLSAHLFLESIDCQIPWINYTLRIGMALLLTIFEGNTEFRSVLLSMIKLEDIDQVAEPELHKEVTRFKNVKCSVKALLMPAPIMHSLYPPIGVITLIVFSSHQAHAHSHSHVAHLALGYRILAFTGSYLLFGIPNFFGNFTTLLPACKETDKKITGFFQCQRDNEEERQPLLSKHRTCCFPCLEYP